MKTSHFVVASALAAEGPRASTILQWIPTIATEGKGGLNWGGPEFDTAATQKALGGGGELVKDDGSASSKKYGDRHGRHE